jgi:hypothetical protein
MKKIRFIYVFYNKDLDIASHCKYRRIRTSIATKNILNK